jgi:hypothetical protein
MVGTVTALTDHESSWVAAVASRLRLIQADTATADSEKRRELLQEELARSLSQVLRANQPRYLEAILAAFPVRGHVLNPVLAPPTPAPVEPPAEASAEEMLERLLASAASLPKERRAGLAKRLTEAGLLVPSPGTGAPELTPELRGLLGLPNNCQVPFDRLLMLLGLLMELFQRLHQTALASLRDLSPQNALAKRLPDFRNIVGLFLTNGDESGERQLRQSGGLPGVMLAAIRGDEKKRTASVFVRRCEERFSPRAIQEVVEAEGRFSFLGSKREKCWEKYLELSKDFANPALMERWIKDGLGRVMDDYLKELDRTHSSGVQ